MTKNSGKITYELVKFGYYDSSGKEWDMVRYVLDLVAQNKDEQAGVVLFELVEDNKLKVEVFPGKTKDQVSGFTSQALKYER